MIYSEHALYIDTSKQIACVKCVCCVCAFADMCTAVRDMAYT